MNSKYIFVGDIHGNSQALKGILSQTRNFEDHHIVFLGDYVNKGPSVREVIEILIELQHSGKATPIAGNHEKLLLSALDTGELAPLLKAGGATTIRSYVGGNVGADVHEAFAAAFPKAHEDFLRKMPEFFETPQFIAQHAAPHEPIEKLTICGHVKVGKYPTIRPDQILLDTGCGHGEGPLSAYCWPSGKVLRVSDNGNPL